MNDHEALVLAEVRAIEPEMLDLLQRLVRINSENPPGRYEEIAPAFAQALAATGFAVEVLPVPAAAVAAQGLDLPRLNVVGRRRAGRDGPRLMLNAHLDTVPIGAPAGWTRDPLGGELADGRVWGRGAVDSKGRLAAYWAAATAVIRAGGPWRGELLVVATCDEETGGDLGARWLMEQTDLKADHAIVEGYNRPIVRAASGILWLAIDVAGRAAHASWPWRGHNAIVDAAALIQELESLRLRLGARRGDIPGIPHTTMSVGVIQGGTKVNVVPERCRLQVDFRVMPGVETAAIRAEIGAIVERLTATRSGFSASVSVLQEQPAMVTDEESPVIQALAQAVEDLTGERPAIEGEPGGTDARWFNRAGIATVNYGPGSPEGGNFHAPDENVGLDQLREAAAVCALTAARLLAPSEEGDSG